MMSMQCMRMMRISGLVCFVSLCVHVNLVAQSERILLFESDITIHPDASLSVRETITVSSTGDQIVHGIVHEFPTQYQYYLLRHHVGFAIDAVEQDNHAAMYVTKKVPGGTKIYIGDADILLSPGRHVYRIAYTTTRQLSYFDDHDELYWNVTGNRWRLPIDQVHAVVHLPADVPVDNIQVYAYTGPLDSIAQNYTISRDDHIITYTTTHSLKTKEGLTIVAGWPKGYIVEPDRYTRWYWLFRDNAAFIISELWILLLLGWALLCYVYLYFRHRRATRVPLFYPPEGMSPSAVGYMYKRIFDPSFLAADIIDLAVHGWVHIAYEKSFLDYTYTLTCTKELSILEQDSTLGAYQKQLLSALFSSRSTIVLNRKQEKVIKDAMNLEKKYNKATYGHYITHCIAFHIIAACISIIMFMSLLFFEEDIFPPEQLLCIIIVALLTHMTYEKTFMMVYIKDYTSAGQKIKNAIDGFTMFLSATEKERLAYTASPTLTLTLYEKYLPYAMILGLEKRWTTQFAAIFTQMEQAGQPYKPMWYIGRLFRGSSFASGFSKSLNSSLSQSLSRSSGLGESGGSGRGRGGGGGGGW